MDRLTTLLLLAEYFHVLPCRICFVQNGVPGLAVPDGQRYEYGVQQPRRFLHCLPDPCREGMHQ
jgi:hypothetical protein